MHRKYVTIVVLGTLSLVVSQRGRLRQAPYETFEASKFVVRIVKFVLFHLGTIAETCIDPIVRTGNIVFATEQNKSTVLYLLDNL